MAFIKTGRAVGCLSFDAAASHFFDAAASSDGDFGSQQRLQQQEGGEEHLATMGQGPGTPVFLPNKPIF